MFVQDQLTLMHLAKPCRKRRKLKVPARMSPVELTLFRIMHAREPGFDYHALTRRMRAYYRRHYSELNLQRNLARLG